MGLNFSWYPNTNSELQPGNKRALSVDSLEGRKSDLMDTMQSHGHHTHYFSCLLLAEKGRLSKLRASLLLHYESPTHLNLSKHQRQIIATEKHTINCMWALIKRQTTTSYAIHLIRAFRQIYPIKGTFLALDL